MEAKFCSKCGIEKPATSEYFVTQKLGKYGFRADCKTCGKNYQVKYEENYKDKLKETKKKYRENNRVQIREQSKEYYERNKEKIKAYRDSYKDRRVDYKINNRERFNAYQQTRKTLKANLPSTLTIKQWKSTKAHFNHECAYCGKHFKNLSQDHIVPLSRGGGFTKGNILPSCQLCNNSKRASNMKTWYTKQSYFSIERYNKILAFIKEHKSIYDHTPIPRKR